MSDRATVNQRAQIAVEATPGTFVPAQRYLQSFSIKPELKFESHEFTPEGQKYVALVIPSKEWSEASYDGELTYTELVYPLSGCMNYAAPVQNSTTGTYVWNFSPDTFSPDTVKTFSVEQGTPGVTAFGQHFANGTFLGCTMTADRREAKAKGKMLGQLMTTNVAISSSVAPVDLQPVIPNNISVFLDSTYVNVGATPDITFTGTQLLRTFSVEFMLENRFEALWPLDGTKTSWAATVEAKPKASGRIKMEADAAAIHPSTGLLSQLRGAATRYLTIQAVSPNFIQAAPISFSGGGSGASAIALLEGGKVVAIYLISGGTGYTAPGATFGGAGSGATATVTVSTGVITAVTLTAGGTGYTSAYKYAYLFQAPIKIKNPTAYSDDGGVYAIEFEWEAVHDPAFLPTGGLAAGGAMFLQVQNAQATL